MDWKEIYSAKNIKGWGLPASSSITRQGLTHGLVLTWSELETAFRNLTPPPDEADNIWYIVCDVLVIDTNPVLCDQMVIFARRIEINNNIVFLIQGDPAYATIVTQEIVRNNEPASLQVSFIPDDDSKDPVTRDLTPFQDSPVTLFKLRNPANVKSDDWVEKAVWISSDNTVSKLRDNLSNGEPLRLSMVSTFQVATLIAESTDPALNSNLKSLGTSSIDLAIKQLAWVAAITGIAEDTHVMSGQARTQLTWLVNRKQGVNLVPPLDFSIYKEAAKERIDILKFLNQKYESWLNIERTSKDWLSQAKLTVGMQTDEIKLQSQLEGNARSKLKAVEEAEQEAAKQLSALEEGILKACYRLEEGIKIWKRSEKIDAAFKLFVDIFKFGVAVGKTIAMVAAPNAGTAGGAGKSGGDAAARAVDVKPVPDAGEKPESPSQFEQIKKLAEPLGEIGGAAVTVVSDINKIIQIGRTADALNSLASDTLKKVDESLDKTFTVTPLKGLDIVTGGKQVWESVLVTMNQIFSTKDDLFKKIDGGPEFITVFRQLVISGESYCSTRLAVAEARNSLAISKLHIQASERRVRLAMNTQEEFETRRGLYEQLEQEAFGRVLDAKRAVYLELEKYALAFHYFTLNRIPYSIPALTAPINEFIDGCNRMINPELIGELISIPETLDSLPVQIPVSNNNRFGKTIIVRIDVTDPAFQLYCRIRINKVDINLADNKGKSIPVKYIKLGTTGSFRDIMPDGSIAQFSGNPFLRTITYNPDGKIILDSKADARFQDVIFKPTPFSTWSFELPDEETVKNVEKLTFTISGEASSL